MRINPINTQNNSPIFNSNMRKVVESKTGRKYWTTSYLFRDDLEWWSLSELLEKKYKHSFKVNVLNHACSNGLEPMSLAMLFLTKMKRISDKFFPIIAKDINAENISMAKNNEPIEVDQYDLLRLNLLTKDSISEFFFCKKHFSTNRIDSIIPKPIFKKKIKYQQGDLLEDIKHLPSKNNLVLCRNCWLYLTSEQQEELAKRLGEKLDNTSLVIIGHFDEQESKACELLNKNGFVETSVKHVYEKTDKAISKDSYSRDARLYHINYQDLYKQYPNGIIKVKKV